MTSHRTRSGRLAGNPTSGQVPARNLAYNATIPANGSVTVGFQATHTGNTDRPNSLQLNGASYTIT